MDIDNPQIEATTACEADWDPFLIPIGSEDAWRVEDAEEELFLLYSGLQGSSGLRSDYDDDDNDASTESGLGSVNPKEGELTVILPTCRCQTCNVRRAESSPGRRKGSKKSTLNSLPTEVSLFQDLTALNSRKGDTGSVLWRASKKLAHLLLSESIISHSSLSTCQILELGAGTGLLAIALEPLVKRYIATDLPPSIPLIAKNVSRNSSLHPNISIDALDWVEFQSLSLNTRLKAYKELWIDEPLENSRPRIILVVDCVYNPSLIDPLVTVINHFSSSKDKQKTIVLVVMELRSEEVTRLFLSRWMDSGQWEIWSLRVLGTRFAFWVGRQTSR